MGKKFITFNDADEIKNYLLNQWINLSDEYISENGFFSAALSGGNSPKSFYDLLFNSEKKIQWDKIFVFLVDERFVPKTHKDSNSGMIKNIIKDKKINFYPIDTENNIKKSVRDYETKVKNFFNSKKKDNFSFDFVLLGVGSDGHTASLFPETKSLNINDKLITEVRKEGIIHARISMTFRLLNNAKNIFFLATGEDKAQIINEIINKNKNYPANMINPPSNNVLYVLDKNSSKFL